MTWPLPQVDTWPRVTMTSPSRAARLTTDLEVIGEFGSVHPDLGHG